ncbi:hypothetical protein [Helicobacter pylori]|nr:hypothetical protein [Helicobacter pylori]
MHASLSSVFYHQARFFVTPTINPLLLQVFSNRLIIVILEGRGGGVLKAP